MQREIVCVPWNGAISGDRAVRLLDRGIRGKAVTRRAGRVYLHKCRSVVTQCPQHRVPKVLRMSDRRLRDERFALRERQHLFVQAQDGLIRKDLVATHDAGLRRLFGNPAMHSLWAREKAKGGKKVKIETPPLTDATEAAIQHFAKSIREDKEPLANVDAGRHATCMALLGRTAIHEKRAVEWKEVAL